MPLLYKSGYKVTKSFGFSYLVLLVKIFYIVLVLDLGVLYVAIRRSIQAVKSIIKIKKYKPNAQNTMFIYALENMLNFTTQE